MRHRFVRLLVGVLAFFAPTAVALLAPRLDRSVGDGDGYAWFVPIAGIVSVLVGAAVPALLLLKSGLPPNTRVGTAIVVIALLVAECLSITYIVLMNGTTG